MRYGGPRPPAARRRQRDAIARTRAELDRLDQRLASLETELQTDGVDPDHCIAKGGEIDDRQRRLRTGVSVPADAGLPVPADAGLPVLTGR